MELPTQPTSSPNTETPFAITSPTRVRISTTKLCVLNSRNFADPMASDANRDISMGSSPPPVPATDDEPKYGGYSRFEIELEVRIHPSFSLLASLTLNPP